MFTSGNQTSTEYTYSAAISSANLIVEGGTRRVAAHRIVPDGLGQTSFVVTASASRFWSYYIVALSGVDSLATIASASDNSSNTSAALAIPSTTLGYTSNGTERAFWAGGVNATATWTTDPDSVSVTTGGNAALQVSSKAVLAAQTSLTYTNFNRGLDGTTRNESALSLVLQAVPDAASTSDATLTLMGV